MTTPQPAGTPARPSRWGAFAAVLYRWRLYRRTVSPPGVTPSVSSSFRNGPSTRDRLRYLAVLAGLDERELPLRATEGHSVRWQGADHLQQVIEGVRADILDRHAHLVSLLLQRGALLDDEAQELPPVTIDVVLHDDRAGKTSPLRPQ